MGLRIPYWTAKQSEAKRRERKSAENRERESSAEQNRTLAALDSGLALDSWSLARCLCSRPPSPRPFAGPCLQSPPLPAIIERRELSGPWKRKDRPGPSKLTFVPRSPLRSRFPAQLEILISISYGTTIIIILTNSFPCSSSYLTFLALSLSRSPHFAALA